MDWRDIRILITGVSGFVGPLLAQNLAAKGADIYGFDIKAFDSSFENRFKHRIEDILTFIQDDLRNLDNLEHVLRKYEPHIIFHLGGVSHVSYSFDHPTETAEINTLGTSNLLEAIRITDINQRFIFAGSSEEYGLVLSSEKQ